MIIHLKKQEPAMPMIDVTAAPGTFGDKKSLAKALADAMMRWEGVPAIPLFLDNTAAFVHELDAGAMSNAAGRGDYVRVEILTPEGVLDRDEKLGVVKEMTDIIADAAGDPRLRARTWVLISESPDGGWGIGGHAYTNAEIAETARRDLTGT
jgi:phenylpyruvate tautomerase PptA (4-oxalocrotonate tautomerase family)